MLKSLVLVVVFLVKVYHQFHLAKVEEFKGIEYFDADVRDGRIILAPVRMQPMDANLEGIRKKMEKLGITPADVTEAVRWARKSET
jgi:hypothetical protein